MIQRLENSKDRFETTLDLSPIESAVQMTQPGVNALVEAMRRGSNEILNLPPLLVIADQAPDAKAIKAKELSKDEVEQIHGFLEQLGSQNYHEREAATKALKQFGTAALPYIQDKLKSSDAEVQMRCEALINAQVRGGALIPIDRLPEGNQVERAKPAVFAGFAARILGAFMGLDDGNRQTAQEYKEVQKFAEDPARRPKRQEKIEEILDLQAKGKIELSPEDVRILEAEQLNLKYFDKLGAWLEADLAIIHAEAGEIEKTKELLLKAVKHDPSVKHTHMVAGAIYEANLGKDEQFKKDFEKIAGDAKKIWDYRPNPQQEGHQALPLLKELAKPPSDDEAQCSPDAPGSPEIPTAFISHGDRKHEAPDAKDHLSKTLPAESSLRDGDIIFQSSDKHDEGKAIQIVSKSPLTHCGILFKEGKEWYVYEAVDPVKKTLLKDFAKTADGQTYAVRRLNDDAALTPDALKKMRSYLDDKLGKPYDHLFGWSNEKFYCSELVWKAYYEATKLKIGKVKMVGDFDLTVPLVKSLVEARYGKNVPVTEPTITPGDMYSSKRLKTVK